MFLFSPYGRCRRERAPRGNTSAFIYLWSPSICPNEPGLGAGGICGVQQTNTWNGRRVFFKNLRYGWGGRRRSRRILCLSTPPSRPLGETGSEAVQLSLHYPPGHFKKTPRCSTPGPTHSSSTAKPRHRSAGTHTHNTCRAGWCEHYPLDFRLPLHLTHTAHSCLLPRLHRQLQLL